MCGSHRHHCPGEKKVSPAASVGNSADHRFQKPHRRKFVLLAFDSTLHYRLKLSVIIWVASSTACDLLITIGIVSHVSTCQLRERVKSQSLTHKSLTSSLPF